MPAEPTPKPFSGLRPRTDSETVRPFAEREEEWSCGAPIPRVPPSKRQRFARRIHTMSFGLPFDTSDNSILRGIHANDLIRGLK
jgi:hypothetical protein